MENPFYQTLKQMIKGSSDSDFWELVSGIYTFYESHLRNYEKHRRRWRRSSIENHLIKHGGLSPERCVQMSMRIQFCAMWELAQKELVMQKGNSATTTLNMPALHAINRLSNQLIANHRSLR